MFGTDDIVMLVCRDLGPAEITNLYRVDKATNAQMRRQCARPVSRNEAFAMSYVNVVVNAFEWAQWGPKCLSLKAVGRGRGGRPYGFVRRRCGGGRSVILLTLGWTHMLIYAQNEQTQYAAVIHNGQHLEIISSLEIRPVCDMVNDVQHDIDMQTSPHGGLNINTYDDNLRVEIMGKMEAIGTDDLVGFMQTPMVCNMMFQN